MIVRVPHPDRPGEFVYVPIYYDSDRGRWTGIPKPEGPYRAYRTELQAYQACLAQLLRGWADIRHGSQVVRGLCEHPRFDFAADGIDSKLVHKEAYAVARMSERFDDDIRQLLCLADDAIELDVTKLVLVETDG